MDPVVLARALTHNQLLLVLQQLSDVHVSQNLVRSVLPYPDIKEKTERLRCFDRLQKDPSQIQLRMMLQFEWD